MAEGSLPAMTGWVSALAAKTTTAVDLQEQRWRRAEQDVAKARKRLADIEERVENRMAEVLASSAQEQIDHVRQALASGQVASLRRKQLRIAASLLSNLPIAQLQLLMAARPDSRPLLVEAFCNQWTALDGHPQWPALARLVTGGDRAVKVRHGDIEVSLSARTAPRTIVQASPRELADLVEHIQQRLGLRSRWQLTAEIVAEWAARAARGGSFAATWAQLAGQPRFVNPLLPAMDREPWVDGWPQGGGNAPLPTQVALLIPLLHLCLDHPDPAGDDFLDRLLRRSRFGDPRVGDATGGWRALEERDGDLYSKLITKLVTEDLRLFFQHAMQERDRELFWLQYLGTIRSTVAILARETRARLQHALRDTPEGRRVLARTQQASRGTVSAFCLYFKDIVVVEFSISGNAAYIYERALFEKEIYSPGAPVETATELKITEFPHKRILHQADWQTSAAQMLAQYGVHPSGRRSASRRPPTVSPTPSTTASSGRHTPLRSKRASV